MEYKPNIWTSPKFYLTKTIKSGDNIWYLHINGNTTRLYPIFTMVGLLALGMIKLTHRIRKDACITTEAYNRGISDTKNEITNHGLLTYDDVLDISNVLAEKKRNKRKVKYSTLGDTF
jgi:hypothetical protein